MYITLQYVLLPVMFAKPSLKDCCELWILFKILVRRRPLLLFPHRRYINY